MKIYVDGELPKSCAECKILGVFDWCNYLKDCVSDEIKNNKRHVLCPLETTQSLKQQVREEVVDEIFYNLSRIEDTLINCGNGKEDALAYFCEILKKVKGESNVKD